MWIRPLTGVGKIPWRRKWQSTPIFLPGESHGQRSLVGSSPWGRQRVRHNGSNLSTAPTTSSSLPGGQLLSLASENMALMGTSRGQAFGQISSPGAVTGCAQH